MESPESRELRIWDIHSITRGLALLSRGIDGGTDTQDPQKRWAIFCEIFTRHTNIMD